MNTKAKLKATNVYFRNIQCKKRIRVNEGGSRSSKTHSLAQVVITLLMQNQYVPGFIVCVVRKTMPALKATVYKDIMGLLMEYGLYYQENENKTEHTYRVGHAVLEFLSIDDAKKIRGRKRTVLYINEANELDYEDWKQLLLRTSGDVYIDYNPSDQFHWIYDHVLTRDDVEVIHSTYKDNPFNPPEVVSEIERYKLADQNYWRIYGLGLRGISGVTIYSHWQYCDALPETYSNKIFGLDFGYNHPTVLTEIRDHDGSVYVREHIYKSGLDDEMLIAELEDLVKVGVLTKSDYIYGDNEDPKAIEAIRKAGFNIKPAKKGPGSVESGIKLIKSKPFYITKDSVNGIKELKSYSWKEKDGKPTDEPVKVNDDFCDSFRMAVYSFHNRKVAMVY